jgi:hypothetical protein
MDWQGQMRVKMLMQVLQAVGYSRSIFSPQSSHSDLMVFGEGRYFLFRLRNAYQQTDFFFPRYVLLLPAPPSC